MTRAEGPNHPVRVPNIPKVDPKKGFPIDQSVPIDLIESLAPDVIEADSKSSIGYISAPLKELGLKDRVTEKKGSARSVSNVDIAAASHVLRHKGCLSLAKSLKGTALKISAR